MELWVAALAFLGTIIGSLGGVLTANKLTNYRIECLEKKVDKHNCLVERIYKLEGDFRALDELCVEKFKVANHRIDDLKETV